MNARDLSLLADMLENSRHAVAIVGNLDEKALAANPRDRLAASHAIQIVGEAANHVSEQTQSRLAQIPWDAIVGTRHILVHDYGRVDLSIIVEIVRRHLPLLIRELERVLTEEGS
ncbi:MAG: HepT-like ribonuclease domain-containing protein [Caulobacteraceae bacterium]